MDRAWDCDASDSTRISLKDCVTRAAGGHGAATATRAPRIMSGVSNGDGPVFKVIAGTRMIFFICGSHGDSQSQVTSPKFMSLARRGNLKLTVS